MSTKHSDSPKPTDAELDILNILWDRGPATVREVHELLQRAKPTQYTTTLKLMQVMTEKGLLARDESARAHIYRPCVAREQVQTQVASYLLDRLFGGSPRSLLMGALSARRASRKEVEELRRMLAAYERRQLKKGDDDNG
jgi:BlaI family transcriptional regulator, penicillinase repressor